MQLSIFDSESRHDLGYRLHARNLVEKQFLNYRAWVRQQAAGNGGGRSWFLRRIASLFNSSSASRERIDDNAAWDRDITVVFLIIRGFDFAIDGFFLEFLFSIVWYPRSCFLCWFWLSWNANTSRRACPTFCRIWRCVSCISWSSCSLKNLAPISCWNVRTRSPMNRPFRCRPSQLL